jgi:hypothetical protein
MVVNRATLFQMPKFDTSAIHVGFMMGRVAVHSVFLQVFHFFVLVIPTVLHTHIDPVAMSTVFMPVVPNIRYIRHAV